MSDAEDVLNYDNNVDTANPPSWLRARRRARREHFEEIKARVLAEAPGARLDPTRTGDAWATTHLMAIIVLNRQLEVISRGTTSRSTRRSWCE